MFKIRGWPRINKADWKATVSDLDYKGKLKFEDGSVIELVEERFNYPTLIFYPSGENSGGRLEIYHPNYIQRIIVNTNGLIKDEIIMLS